MTKTSIGWWKTEPVSSISEAISLINDGRAESNRVQCFDLFAKATNGLWTRLYHHQKQKGLLSPLHEKEGRGGTASFEELLKVSLSIEAKRKIVDSKQLDALVALKPRIMDHSVLKKENYDPSKIPDVLQDKASQKHTELANAFDRYSDGQSADQLEKVIKKLADVLFMIRSNIAHGEKTPRGPDIEKARRDQKVCKYACPVLGVILSAIFEQPERRLAVYGTLAPGGVNHAKLENLTGTWVDARVPGRVNQRDGLPYFVWELSAAEVEMKIFESDSLERSWSELDRFEGPSYRRIWIAAILSNGTLTVAKVYAEA